MFLGSITTNCQFIKWLNTSKGWDWLRNMEPNNNNKKTLPYFIAVVTK